MDDVKRTAAELLAKEAAAWLQRLKTATPKEQAEFALWLRESHAHVREMLLASSWEVVLHHLGNQHRVDASKLRRLCTNVVAVADRRASTAPKRTLALRWSWIAAMSVTFAITAAVFLGAAPFLREVLWHEFVTSVGEQRTVALEDGSVISLNAQSSVRVDFSPQSRDVHLHDGQALFSVVHDKARPFRVHVGDSVIQAIGTKFDVHRLAGRIDVAVLEGRVQVRRERADSGVSPSLATLVSRTQLAEGEALSISNAGEISVPKSVDITEISAWRQRRLVFRDRPLSEIVDEFQRYNVKPRMRVEGDELRERRFNGVFDADDPEMLVSYLATDSTIAFDRRGDELVIRVRPVIVQSAP